MKKIIIAESVHRLLDRPETMFRRGSIELYPAHSSGEILHLHRSIRADLIVIDYIMPDMDGAGLCCAIRNEDVLKGVSIIMVCAPAEVPASPCLETGANAVITKPVDPSELFARMSELLMVPQRKDLRSFMQVQVNGKQGGAPVMGVSCNISISGMLWETRHALSKGDRLAVTFTIGGRQVATECVIMRVETQAPGKFRHGVKFQNIDTKSLVLIEQFVKGGVKH